MGWRRRHIEHLERRVDYYAELYGRLADRVSALEAERDPTLARLESAVGVAGVRFTYLGDKRRYLSPYKIEPGIVGALVTGWDHQRESIRSFQVDAISELQIDGPGAFRPPTTVSS